MKIKLMGTNNLRETRDHLTRELMGVITDENKSVDPVAIGEVLTNLYDHIQDLEGFISRVGDIDIQDEVEVNSKEDHFDKDMFKV